MTRNRRTTTMIVRREAALSRIGWDVQAVTLEELVLAYLANPSQSLILPLGNVEQEREHATDTERAAGTEEYMP